jgi:membrane-bound lytic murein transglycosylase MltF
MQRFFPQLRVAFTLNPKNADGDTLKQKLAWAFPLTGDRSLYNAANDFFNKLEKSPCHT